MKCLIDFIGPYQGCYAPVPLSGMYLTQLPGIEFANIDQIANADQVTWQGVWDDLQATASDTFREDVIEEFGKRFMLKQITQSVDLGKAYDTTVLTPVAAGLQAGILIESVLPGNQCAMSNLLQIYVQTINFFWSGTNPNPAFEVYFKDADLGTIEFQVAGASVVPGWNQIWIDRTFVATRLFVIVDGNFDDYVNLDISEFFLDTLGNPNFGMYNSWAGAGCQSRIRGAKLVSGVDSEGSNTFGLSAQISAKCNWDQVICTNKRQFASAWQHCLAIEYLNYRISSSRLNRWKTIDKGAAIKLQELYTHKYRGGKDEKTGLEYPGKLQNAITWIEVDDSDCCLKNNNRLISRETQL
jgi:hypothetical protein